MILVNCIACVPNNFMQSIISTTLLLNGRKHVSMQLSSMLDKPLIVDDTKVMNSH